MQAVATDVPTVDQDLTEWGFRQDPYPTMESWRSLGPVVFNEHHGIYMVTSYRDCSRVLGNTKMFDSQRNAPMFERLFGGLTMEALDSPRHHDVRGIWGAEFQRAMLDERRTPLVRRVVTECVDEFVEQVRGGAVVDALSAMTRRIPTLIIAEMLGVEPDFVPQFAAWSDAMSEGLGGSMDASRRDPRVVETGVTATKALNSYMAGAIAERGGCPASPDLISQLVHHDFAAQMDEVELVANSTQLVFAGNSTTARLMAKTLAALAQHPDQRRALERDRSLIPRAIEEVHRWRTLIQSVPRHANSAASFIGDTRIPDGAEIWPLMGAGNRDGERWERPGEFDISRAPRQHLGFGFGMHVCLGMNLARLELQIWLNQILDKLPDYELAGPVEYGTNPLTLSPIAVPISV